MESILGPKCFLSSSFFIITILSIYGIVGAVFNHFQTTKLPNIGEWPFNIRPLFFTFILIQGMFPIVGLFAMLAACKRQPVFLFGSGSVLLAIFTCSCVFGIVSYQVTPQQILDSFYKTFRKDVNKSEIIEWMNEMQWQHTCCGVHSYKDWYIVDGHLHMDSKIPSTCCRTDLNPESKNCLTRNILAGQVNHSQNTIVDDYWVYSQGCGSILVNMRKAVVERLGLEMCICGVVSLLVAIVLYAGVTKFFMPEENSCTSSPTYNGIGSRHSPAGDGSGNVYVSDENNNIARGTGCGRKRRPLERWPKHRPFTSIKGRTSSRSNMRGNISKSKSFILGDAPSNLTPIYEEKDSEVPKNVDMLWYQSLDKNMSTLSTTPMDISSMLLQTMSQQNKKAAADEDTTPRNTIFTLVGERAFTPSLLSQNCSASLMNNNTIKLTATLDGIGMTQCTESSSKLPDIPASNAVNQNNNLEETFYLEDQTAVATNYKQQSDETKAAIENHLESNGAYQNDLQTAEQLNASATPPVSCPTNSKYPNPTSAVRSSTLATIQEESESAKGSPKSKGASPASGCLTPENVTPKPTEMELFTLTPIKGDHEVSCVVDSDCEENNNDNLHAKLNTFAEMKS